MRRINEPHWIRHLNVPAAALYSKRNPRLAQIAEQPIGWKRKNRTGWTKLRNSAGSWMMIEWYYDTLLRDKIPLLQSEPTFVRRRLEAVSVLVSR